MKTAMQELIKWMDDNKSHCTYGTIRGKATELLQSYASHPSPMSAEQRTNAMDVLKKHLKVDWIFSGDSGKAIIDAMEEWKRTPVITDAEQKYIDAVKNKSCAICGYFCNNVHHYNNWYDVSPESPMSAEQVEVEKYAGEMTARLASLVYRITKVLDDKDKQLSSNGYDLQNELRKGFMLAEELVKNVIAELPTTPSVKADGWVSVDKEKEFQKVLKCLKNNKVMVGTREDGIYIRLAGRESEGEAFTLHFALAYPFPKLPAPPKQQ